MKRLLITFFLIFGFVAIIWALKDSATDLLSIYFDPEAEEPIPTVSLQRTDYEIRVMAQGELTGFQTIPVMTPRVRTGALKIAWLVAEGSIVEPGAAIVRFDRTDAQMQLEENETSVTSYDQQIVKADADAEGQLEVLDLDRQAADLEFVFARDQIRKDETIFSRWEIQESVMSAALADFKKLTLDEKGQLQQGLSEADRGILMIEQKKAQTEVNLARETLSSLELRTPVGGVVLYKRIGRWTEPEVGVEVWGGHPLIDIADLQQFQAEVHLAETDSAGVQPGKSVGVYMNALPGQKFLGEVSRVSTVAKQRSRKDPRKYFTCTVVIQVPPELMGDLKPGMRLAAEIEVDQKENSFVIPKSAVFKEEQGFRVYIEEGSDYSARDIEIQDSDHGFFVVSGVEEGERLCLRHPFEKEKLRLPDFNAPTAATRTRRFVVVF
jgi:multidrug efflux pump subunit AcrA (membrane-fusion protein)